MADRQELLRRKEQLEEEVPLIRKELGGHAQWLEKLAKSLRTHPERICIDSLAQGGSMTGLERVGAEDISRRNVDIVPIGAKIQELREKLRELHRIENELDS